MDTIDKHCCVLTLMISIWVGFLHHHFRNCCQCHENVKQQHFPRWSPNPNQIQIHNPLDTFSAHKKSTFSIAPYREYPSTFVVVVVGLVVVFRHCRNNLKKKMFFFWDIQHVHTGDCFLSLFAGNFFCWIHLFFSNTRFVFSFFLQ